MERNVSRHFTPHGVATIAVLLIILLFIWS